MKQLKQINKKKTKTKQKEKKIVDGEKPSWREGKNAQLNRTIYGRPSFSK